MTPADSSVTDTPGADQVGGHPGQPAIPLPQLLLDDIFLLVAIGLVVPTLVYIVWGLMELASVPVFAP